MRRLWLPDFEKKLIEELQRQQHSSQFCDTLLQTGGISIPIHSSVLGALSLPLSQRLSASPAPPAGEKRRLQLHTVKPQTLLKLVGLLYSGELEVNDAVEQRDVLAAAHLFGLPDLLEGEKCEGKSSRKGCKDAKIRRADVQKRDMKIQVASRSFYVTTGTQTVMEDTTRPIGSSQHRETATTSSQLITYRFSAKGSSKTLLSTTCLTNSSECSDGKSIHEQLSDCTTSATSSLLCLSEKMALPLSSSESSNCSMFQEDEALPNVPGTSAVLVKGSLVVEEDGQRKLSENRKRPYQENMERDYVVEKRRVVRSVAKKSLAKMQEMMEETHLSIKVKLRRRKEEVWEVVDNMQDADALSGVPAQRLDSYQLLQEDLAAVQPSVSTAVCRSSLPQFIPSSPSPCPHASDDSTESYSVSNRDSVPLQACPGEETDDQIEKLLEDIMIGLNILPNIEKGSNKSQDRNLRPDGGSGQVQDKASYCAHYEDYGTTDKALPEPGCRAHPSMNPSSSARRTNGPQNLQSPQTPSCLSENHNPNPQEDPNILELLPIPTDEVNLFNMADLQFLPCLSPLDSNNNTTSGNKTQVQSFLHGKSLLTGNPCSAEFSYNSNAEPDGALVNCQPEKNDEVLQNAQRKCPNKTCRNLRGDATINLSHCLVSLSSNNVLANERRALRNTASRNARETEQETDVTRSLRSNTKVRRAASTRTPIRLRRKSQSQSAPTSSTPDLDKSQTIRKRRRPRKRHANVVESEQQIESPCLEQTEETKPKTKRRSRKRDLGNPSEQVPFEAEQEDDDRMPPEEKKPCIVGLRKYKAFLKRRHSKTRRVKNKCEKEESENTENGKREDATMSDPVQETANSHLNDVDETQDGYEQNGPEQLLNPSANPQKTPPQADDNGTSSSLEKNLFSEVSGQSDLCIGLVSAEVTKLSEEMEHGQKTSPELFDDGGPDSATENELTIDEDSFPLDDNPQQENVSADHNPDSPESKNIDGGDTGDPKPTEECEGGPQDDDEEVDVLLHSSPDRVSETTEGHKSLEVSLDEEEEEESNEVDVTGSETDA